MAIGFVNTIDCKQSTSLTCPTTFAKAEGPYRLTSGSVLSSQPILGMSSSHPLKMLLAARFQFFTNSASLRQRLPGSTIFLVSRRSFRTFTDYWVFEVRFRYNLPSCQASDTNLSDTLSISRSRKHHYSRNWSRLKQQLENSACRSFTYLSSD